MNKLMRQRDDAQDDVWRRYRGNFPRHLLAVSYYLQSSAMHQLQQDYGHSNLRLGFAPYMTLLGEQGMRLSELAAVLGISRQACNQAANQIEAAGYVIRTADISDGRARQLVLTEKGLTLRDDGSRVIAQLNNEFVRLASQSAVADAAKSLGRIFATLELPPAMTRLETQADTQLSGLLPTISDYIVRRLMELTRAKGHPGLKLSSGQVLMLISPSGGRIQHIAKVQGVSKQAISAIATELEYLGYLQRDPDPSDARQLVLQFTERGRGLIADSVASVQDLEAEFSSVIGVAALKRLQSTFLTLYRELQLEQGIFEHGDPVNIGLLAQQLQQQLGRANAQQLAELILSSSTK